jgi:hypothetical protein
LKDNFGIDFDDLALKFETKKFNYDRERDGKASVQDLYNEIYHELMTAQSKPKSKYVSVVPTSSVNSMNKRVSTQGTSSTDSLLSLICQNKKMIASGSKQTPDLIEKQFSERKSRGLTRGEAFNNKIR